MSEITHLLLAIKGGDDLASTELLPHVYDELRRIARSKMVHERSEHTLQATALVHEAYLRLLGADNARWDNRAHFFSAAAEAMRRILIEHARAKNARTVRNDGPERQTAGFLFCWVVCFVGFFTFAATKLPNYVVPCYPALAIMCGWWLKSAVDKSKIRNRLLTLGYGAFAIAGIATAIALTFTARILLQLDFKVALPGVVAAFGGIVCVLLMRSKRPAASVSFYVATCLAFTLSANIYTAARVNSAQDGPRLAERIHSASLIGSQRESRVATCDYLPPSLVFYLGHSVERLGDPSDISKFFEAGGSAVVMSESSYEKSKPSLEVDAVLLTVEQRFLRHQKVVLLGRANQVARRTNSVETE